MGKIFGGQKPPKPPTTPKMPKPEDYQQAGESAMRIEKKKKDFEYALGSTGNAGLKTFLG